MAKILLHLKKWLIRCNNTQNSIKETDFYANNSEQIEIQRLMSEQGFFYEIKRGDRKYLGDNPKGKTQSTRQKMAGLSSLG